MCRLQVAPEVEHPAVPLTAQSARGAALVRLEVAHQRITTVVPSAAGTAAVRACKRQ